MTISAAKLAANRRNAQLSTGPKTPEGKARSRCNAFKHGLTGQGVALPSEDVAEVKRRFETLDAEMRPSCEAGRILLHRFAFMSVRVGRCERNDTAELSKKVRHAVALHDDERLAAVEALGHKLYTEPATTARRLQMTPEGIDWLLNDWSILRADLNHGDGNRWTDNHRMRFDSLLGLNPGGYRIARIRALSEAVDGGFYHLDKADGVGLEGPARAEWAKIELTRLIDVEVARLKEAHASFDHEGLAADRADAVDRVLFDPSPERVLARKYEAATERALYRALKEFREVEADAVAAEGIESAVSDCELEDAGPVGSNLPETDPEPTEPEPRPDAPSWMVDFGPAPCSVLDFAVGKGPEAGPRGVGSPGQDMT